MQGGKDSDGHGTEGMVEEKTREARAGETGTTRFGMEEEGADSDSEDSGGLVDKKPIGGSAGGLASNLQSGGTKPGGGPGTGSGGLGTGGGANSDEDTGSLRRWDDGEQEGSRP